MPNGQLLSNDQLRTYAQLRRAVETLLIHDQQQVDVAQVMIYWTTGDYIHRHVLAHTERADYGDETIDNLSRDVRKGRRLLYRCLEFRRAYPIVSARPQLLWAHDRVLMLIIDPVERGALEVAANAQGWTSRQLEERARPLLLAQKAPSVPAEVRPNTTSKLLVPKRGVVGIRRIVPGAETLAIDLGLTSYEDLTPEQAGRCEVGDLVRFDAAGRLLKADDAKPADLYTYRADCLRAVDGDTIWFRVHLVGRRWLKEKVRLRGVDCMEMDTAAGRTAKRFTEELLARAKSVTITLTKPDKYDRYLADVHIETEDAGVIFLNNALLENGHARPTDKYALEDWEKDTGGVPA